MGSQLCTDKCRKILENNEVYSKVQQVILCLLLLCFAPEPFTYLFWF